MSVFLSFLVSSYNNPKRLENTLTVIRSMSLPFTFNVRLALFEHDSFENQNIQIAKDNDVDYFVLKAHSHAIAQNLISTASDGRLLLGIADDVEVFADGASQWGEHLAELTDGLKDDVFAVFGSAAKQRPIIPRRVIDTLGYYKCPIFYDLDWCDAWYGSIMTKIGRCFRIPELLLSVVKEQQDPEYFSPRNADSRAHERVTFEHCAPVRTNAAELLSTMTLE